MIDLSAPYMQRALLEMLLLAVPAGLLGSWIVLRRLAFFTHAVGTVSFPALVLASAWGIAPQLAALAAALGFGVAQERLVRTRPARAPTPRRACCSSARWRPGVVLASDVFESGAEVDTLLFGSLIGLSARDVWLTALVAAGAVALDGGAAPPLARRRLRARQRAARSACARSRPTGCCSPASRPRRSSRSTPSGRCSSTVVLVVPAATARLLTDRLAPLQLGAIALAAVEGVAAVCAGRRAQRRRRPRAGRARRRRCSPPWRAATALRARAVPA